MDLVCGTRYPAGFRYRAPVLRLGCLLARIQGFSKVGTTSFAQPAHLGRLPARRMGTHHEKPSCGDRTGDLLVRGGGSRCVPGCCWRRGDPEL